LHKPFNASVKFRLCTFSKKAARDFSGLPVVCHTLTTDTLPGTAWIGAGAVHQIGFLSAFHKKKVVEKIFKPNCANNSVV